MDLGRDGFDWARMRQEEAEYFDAKRSEPKTISTAVKGVLTRSMDAAEGRKDPVAAKLRSLPYSEYLKTDHWQATRARALQRDGYQCRICASGKSLEVHHLTYERRGEERAIDLITLCERCHAAQHSR